MTTTKERILKASLDLFADYGYEAVSVAKIAETVGIKAPSLYKHYKSKRDIFEAIIEEMDQRYKIQTSMMNMNGMDADEDRRLFTSISQEQLISMGRNLFLYFIHDEFASKFRRMLTIEQFHNQKLAAYFKKQYFDDVLAYQECIFNFLGQSNCLRAEDPKIMALHFYSPMYTLMTLCDSQPDREEEALELLEQHIRQFNRIYQDKGEE